jgi:hypothetical protein
MPCLCEVYPGICLTTEEKAWKNLSQGNVETISPEIYHDQTLLLYCLTLPSTSRDFYQHLATSGPFP